MSKEFSKCLMHQKPEENKRQKWRKKARSALVRKVAKLLELVTSSARETDENPRPYIYNVLKQVNPDVGVSSKAMSTMNFFINDIFGKKKNTQWAKVPRLLPSTLAISRPKSAQTTVFIATYF